MTQNDFERIMIKVKGYIKENWGSPFIAGFMLLLVVAAVFLSVGWFYIADSVAAYAYYALVIGFFFQLASFLKYRGKGDQTEVTV